MSIMNCSKKISDVVDVDWILVNKVTHYEQINSISCKIKQTTL